MKHKKRSGKHAINEVGTGQLSPALSLDERVEYRGSPAFSDDEKTLEAKPSEDRDLDVRAGRSIADDCGIAKAIIPTDQRFVYF